MIYFQKFSVSGTENKVEFDSGLESSRENPKRLLSCLIQVDTYKDNDVQGWWEREKVFELPDKLLDTIEEGSTEKISKSFNRLNEIEVGYDLPVGSTFKIAISCGGTANNIIGAYRYEIVR